MIAFVEMLIAMLSDDHYIMNNLYNLQWVDSVADLSTVPAGTTAVGVRRVFLLQRRDLFGFARLRKLESASISLESQFGVVPSFRSLARLKELSLAVARHAFSLCA